MTVYLTYKFNDQQADFGIFSELYAYATIIISLMVFRMDTVYFRFAASAVGEEKEKVYANTFYLLSAITVFITFILLVFKQTIANALGYPDQAYYVSWFAYILFLDAIITLVYAKFRQESRPLKFLFFKVANVVLTLVFVMLFLEVLPRFFPSVRENFNQWLGISKDLDYVFLSNLLASLGVCFMMLPYLFKIRGKIDWLFIKKALSFSWPLVIMIVANNFNQYVAVPIQNFLLEGSIDEKKAIAGIYSAGSKLAILLNLFTTAFSYAAEPFFFNQASKDKKYEINGPISLAFTILCSLVVLGTYFYIDFILVMIGSGYRKGVVVVPMLLMSYLFLGLFYNVAIWYKLADKTMYGAYITLGGSIITILVSILLLPTIGMIGSAWASLACFAFMLVACYYYGQKYFPIQYPVKKILYYFLITALLLLFSWWLRQTGLSLLIRTIIHTLILFIFTTWVYKVEQSFIQAHFKK
jgi:O-antigen/teichoic acid export membrane protein